MTSRRAIYTLAVVTVVITVLGSWIENQLSGGRNIIVFFRGFFLIVTAVGLTRASRFSRIIIIVLYLWCVVTSLFVVFTGGFAASPALAVTLLIIDAIYLVLIGPLLFSRIICDYFKGTDTLL